jgi:hypothetical protein
MNNLNLNILFVGDDAEFTAKYIDGLKELAIPDESVFSSYDTNKGEFKVEYLTSATCSTRLNAIIALITTNDKDKRNLINETIAEHKKDFIPVFCGTSSDFVATGFLLKCGYNLFKSDVFQDLSILEKIYYEIGVNDLQIINYKKAHSLRIIGGTTIKPKFIEKLRQYSLSKKSLRFNTNRGIITFNICDDYDVDAVIGVIGGYGFLNSAVSHLVNNVTAKASVICDDTPDYGMLDSSNIQHNHKHCEIYMEKNFGILRPIEEILKTLYDSSIKIIFAESAKLPETKNPTQPANSETITYESRDNFVIKTTVITEVYKKIA